jgi:hypothetical protein
MRLFGRRKRFLRRHERDEERISLRVNLDASVSHERITQSPAVLSERLAVPFGAELLKQARRAFDVREQKGNGAGG